MLGDHLLRANADQPF